MIKKPIPKDKILVSLLLLILVGIIIYQQFYLYNLDKNIVTLSIMTQNSLDELENAIDQDILSLKRETQSKFEDLSSIITESQSDIVELKQELGDVKVQSADFSGIIEDVIKGVVSVKTDTGQASGAIISEDGYIVTNEHVISDARRIRVITYDNRAYNADLIGYSRLYDVAVLKIDKDNLDYLRFGDSDKIKVGQRAIALGNPLGLSFSVTEGIISAVHREGLNNLDIYLQIDVPINPGNSGGPLINTKREIIGITNFKIGGVGVESIGFAIESNTVKDVIDEIIREYQLLLQQQAF